MNATTPAVFAIIVSRPSSPSLSAFRFFSTAPTHIIKYEVVRIVSPAKVDIIYTDVFVCPPADQIRFSLSSVHAEGVLFSLQKVYPHLTPLHLGAPCPARWGTSMPEWADSFVLWNLSPCVGGRKSVIRCFLGLRNYIAQKFFLPDIERKRFLDIGYVRLLDTGRFEFLSALSISDAGILHEVSRSAGIPLETAREFVASFSDLLRFLSDLGVLNVYAVAMQFDLVNRRYTV